MKKMRIPFGTLMLTEYSKNLIQEILNSNRLSCGKYVRKLEKGFASLLGVKEAVAVSSGGDAVALSLAVLYEYGAKRGDEIILPALSFIATGNSVLQAGFIPVFVDIERDTLNINPENIEAVITPRTRALLPVHLMGKPCNMDRIIEIARKHNLFVIEDAAEAHGALYKGRPVGAIGDMGAFSLYVAHIVSTVEGGIITTDNEEYASILRSLRNHGRACTCVTCTLNTSDNLCSKRFRNESDDDIRFRFDRLGFSSKMNELEAAIGLGNLEIIGEILEKRRKNLYFLLNEFNKFSPYLFTIKKEPWEELGPHALPIIISEEAGFSRKSLIKYLYDNGIDSRSLFLSMPTQCPGFSFLGYKLGDFPEAEYVGKNGIHIGVHQDLEEEDCVYILETIDKFLKMAK